MTVAEVFKQATALSAEERRELVILLVKTLGETTPQPEVTKHEGRELVAFVKSLDLSDWEALDADDASAWLTRVRAMQDSERPLRWDLPL
ncbi:MAG: hypothetical protein MUF38_14590 [Anaerolineae bacterium]|nr:hypothetical protein [Anaerolineae bacterium]